MKMLHEPTERVKSGLKEAITLLCKTGLNFQSEMSIDGLLGITLDQNEVFLVSIKEIIKNPRDFQVTSSGGFTELGEGSGEPEGSVTDEAEDLSIHSSRVRMKREKARRKRKSAVPPLLNIPHPIYSKKPCLDLSRPSSNGSAETSASESGKDLVFKSEFDSQDGDDSSSMMLCTQAEATDLSRKSYCHKPEKHGKKTVSPWGSSMKLPVGVPVAQEDTATQAREKDHSRHGKPYQKVPLSTCTTASVSTPEDPKMKSLGSLIENAVDKIVQQEPQSPKRQPSLIVGGTSDAVEDPAVNPSLRTTMKAIDRDGEMITIKGEPPDTCSTPGSCVDDIGQSSTTGVWGTSQTGLAHHSQSVCSNTSLVAQGLGTYPSLATIPDYDAHTKWLQTIAAYVGQTPATFSAYSSLAASQDVSMQSCTSLCWTSVFIRYMHLISLASMTRC